MADTVQLDVLEKRIAALESLVFGNADKDALYPKVKLQTRGFNPLSIHKACSRVCCQSANPVSVACSSRSKINVDRY